MALNSELLDIIDSRIQALAQRVSAVGTIIEWSPPSAMVLFDGSALAVPVKVFNDVDGREGDRCGLMKFGNDWAVTGSFGARWAVQSGQELLSFTSATLALWDLDFPKPFVSGSAPRVVVNINSSAGVTARWGCRAYLQTNTGFRIFAYSGDNPPVAQTWTDIPITWIAVDDQFRQ